jgi:hypothetical protein
LIRVVSARAMSARERLAMKKARKVPAAFASEAEERVYWEREDSTADLDWRLAARSAAQPSAEHDRDLAQAPGEPFGGDQDRPP